MQAPVGALRGITVDVADLDRAEAFWGRLLRLGTRRRAGRYLWFDEAAPGVHLILQEVPEAKSGKNRVHLELTSARPEDLISSVTDMGGTRIRRVQEDGYSLTVVADPDGNEFCILHRASPALTPADGMPRWSEEGGEE